MLEIKELHVSVDNKPVLNGISLNVKAGEIHAIMGPNGSGKSTLSHVLAGREGYEVTHGTIAFEHQNVESMKIEQRAHKGIFLAMQYPVELPGVNNMVFLREALNAKRNAQGLAPLDAVKFMQLVREKNAVLKLDEKLLKRNVNVGFSGGEKKRNEILQMALLEPKLSILDETDSGLDIDALRIVANGVNGLRDAGRAMIIVTHYQRLLNYIEPDFVHVLSEGKIVRTGDKSLALELEEKGYAWITQGVAA